MPDVHVKSRTAMEKSAFNKKNISFTGKLDLNLREKLVKYYTWNIALCGTETWRLWKVGKKYLEHLIYSAGEGWRRSVGPFMWEMKEYYKESRQKGMSFIQ
jgi:hypothetical protein